MINEDKELELVQEATGWEIEAARCLTENTPAQLQEAVIILKGIKALRKQLDEVFAEPKKKAQEAKQALTNAMRSIDDPLSAAEATIKEKIGLWYEHEENQQTKEYEDRMLAARRNAEEMRRLEAGALKDAGEEESAKQLLASELLVSPIPKPKPTKVEGVSVYDRWSAELVDLGKLIEFVAKNKEWHHLLTVDSSAANKLATAQKENLSIPGLKAVTKRVVTVRV